MIQRARRRAEVSPMATELHQPTSAAVGDGEGSASTVTVQSPPPAYEEHHLSEPPHRSSSLYPPAYDAVASNNNGDTIQWTPPPYSAVFVTTSSQPLTTAEMYPPIFEAQPPSYNSITSQQRAGTGAAGINIMSAGFNTHIPATHSPLPPYLPASVMTSRLRRSASVDTTSTSALDSVFMTTQRRASDSQSVSIVGPAVLLDARRLASEPTSADDGDQSESSERGSRGRHSYLSQNNEITALSRRINDNYGAPIPDEKVSCWMVMRYVLKFFIVVFGLPGPGLVLVIAFGFLADAASVTTKTRRVWLYWTIAIFLGLTAIGVNILFWALLIQNHFI